MLHMRKTLMAFRCERKFCEQLKQRARAEELTVSALIRRELKRTLMATPTPGNATVTVEPR